MSTEIPVDILIDRSSAMPLYHQVVAGIEAAIDSGALPGGSKLENEIELAARLKLSRPTVRKALDQLVQAGLLVRKRGVGTQVIAGQVRRNLELSSLYDDLLRSGSNPSTSVLSFAHLEAPEQIRQQLSLAPGSWVYHLRRLRKVDRKPLALMENWVRADMAELNEIDLQSEGLYAILRAAGVNFSLAQQRIGATLADEFQAEHLQTEPGAALVTMERTAVDDTGRNIETGRHVYRADSYSFDITLVQR